MTSVSMNRLFAVALAGAVLPLAARAESGLDAGADIRIRQEFLENVPYGGYMGDGGPSPYMNWLKFRTRVWARAEGDGFGVYGRIANEFRAYPTDETENWRFPDELFLDNLYLDLLDLGGFADLRVGRQDFVGPDAYGAGRVLMDGNNIDGSRSQFFDAVRLRLKESETDRTTCRTSAAPRAVRAGRGSRTAGATRSARDTWASWRRAADSTTGRGRSRSCRWTSTGSSSTSRTGTGRRAP